MSDEGVIEKVRAFSTKAHGEQKRKYTPDPYIVHPVRVMEICRTRTADACILSAALMHDVLEDTPVTKNELLDFLRHTMNENDAQRTLRLVVELTDVYVKAAFPQYNRRKRKDLERQRIALTSPESQTIKYADIIDNCREIVHHDRDFASVFLNECKATLKVIPSGDPVLYEKARRIIDAGFDALGSKK